MQRINHQILFCMLFVGLCLSDAKVPLKAQDQDPTDGPKITSEALDIHHSGMLFDGHNDLPWAMREKASSSFDIVDISKPTKFHTDIPRLKTGGVKAQFWSVFVPASTDFTGNALIQTLEQIRLVKEMCRRYPDNFEMASTVADVQRIAAEGKVASMIGVEGGHSIQNSLQALRQLYAEGARYMTLTHSKTLAWADSCTDEPKNNGLSPFGKDVVREMNRLGMLVDISHVSPKCMKDALETSVAPVIFSHSSVRSICDHPRNVPDDVLKMTAENGGVVMVTFVSAFVVPTNPGEENKEAFGSYKTVVDHIERVIEVAGIDHVGIGSDFDGVTRLPIGLKDVSQYPNITQELLDRGYSKEDIHKILGGNVLRALEQAEQVSKQLKQESQKSTATNKLFSVKVAAGPKRRTQCVVQTEIPPSNDYDSVVTLADSKGNRLLGQISNTHEQAEGSSKKHLLTFVIPELAAGETVTFDVLAEGLNPHRQFVWHDDGSNESELRYGETAVIKYMYEAIDDSSPERRDETYKVYHHVYSPDGSQLVTKGPGGLFGHHRGIYFGFNRIRYGDKQADTWHCRSGESQTHAHQWPSVVGPVFGQDTNQIMWNGQDGQPFIAETRQTTTYKFGKSTLIEFQSTLRSLGAEIVLDGDPQHAGVQFRATQAVPDKTRKKTFYTRPDGIGKPGKFRNWSGKKDESEVNKNHINLPWNALNFYIEDKAFTCCYLDHPNNPKPARFSERDYGRFGSYFKTTVTPEKPLTVRYRFYLQDGPMEIEEIQRLSDDFLTPVSVEIQ